MDEQSCLDPRTQSPGRAAQNTEPGEGRTEQRRRDVNLGSTREGRPPTGQQQRPCFQRRGGALKKAGFLMAW